MSIRNSPPPSPRRPSRGAVGGVCFAELRGGECFVLLNPFKLIIFLFLPSGRPSVLWQEVTLRNSIPGSRLRLKSEDIRRSPGHRFLLKHFFVNGIFCILPIEFCYYASDSFHLILLLNNIR